MITIKELREDKLIFQLEVNLLSQTLENTPFYKTKKIDSLRDKIHLLKGAIAYIDVLLKNQKLSTFLYQNL